VSIIFFLKNFLWKFRYKINRSEMKPFPTCGGVTIAPVAKISVPIVFFFGKRLSANFLEIQFWGIHAISQSDILFVKKNRTNANLV
jgi:hypothetical protein